MTLINILVVEGVEDNSITNMRPIFLTHVSLPIKFWDHSFTFAVYLISRFSTTTLSKFFPPFHAFHNKLPNYKSIKVFECACVPLLRSYN